MRDTSGKSSNTTGTAGRHSPAGADGLAGHGGSDGAPGPALDWDVGHEHSNDGGWLRPAVFGSMDGLVSNFALIAGVGGGHSSHSVIVLTGVAGLVAGAFSMATGEYISVQSQNESISREIEIERHALKHNADAELAELTQVYIDRGVDPVASADVAAQISQDPEQALRVHTLVELGVDSQHLPSPVLAAASSILAFSLGAVLPLVPYLAGLDLLWLSALIFVLAAFGAGAFASRFTIRSWWFGGLRQLVLGGCAAALTFGIGELFHAAGG